jgi:hypothetical protein
LDKIFKFLSCTKYLNTNLLHVQDLLIKNAQKYDLF